MKMFYGIVEDRNDPLKIGRVRVRVHGLHTDDKQMIATPDLSWSQVILPTTSAGLSAKKSSILPWKIIFPFWLSSLIWIELATANNDKILKIFILF